MGPMIPRLPAVLLLALAASLAGPAAAQDGGGLGGGGEKRPNDLDAPLPIRVNQAIDSGVAWLKTQQSPLGNWNPEIQGDRLYDPNAKGDVYVHPTGCTSLALYTLLKCGVSKDDPAVKKGFDWLRKTSGGITKGKAMKTAYRIPNGTYELATLILAIEARANPHKLEKEREQELRFKLKKGQKLKLDVKLDPEDQAWMKELVDALMKRLNKGAGWRYGQWTGTAWHNGPRGTSDLSATNLSMLAILAAERCGIAQSDAFYASMLRWTLTMQEKEGEEHKRWQPKVNEADERYSSVMDRVRGFWYIGPGGDDSEKVATGSMSACGLANIVICSSILDARDEDAGGKGTIFPVDLQGQAEKAWWDGVAWLDYWWTMGSNINHGSYHYYYMYCLERACDLKRIHLLAGHPWYNEGAQVLVDDQLNASTGAWTKQDTHRPCDVLNTCFALLFLNRSTPAITGD